MIQDICESVVFGFMGFEEGNILVRCVVVGRMMEFYNGFYYFNKLIFVGNEINKFVMF